MFVKIQISRCSASIGRVQSRLQQTHVFSDLLAPSSVLRFDIGGPVAGLTGKLLRLFDFHLNNSRFVFLIIPWSQVRVLAGPPIKISWCYGTDTKGFRSLGVTHNSSDDAGFRGPQTWAWHDLVARAAQLVRRQSDRT
jgi:hypothetical protein